MPLRLKSLELHGYKTFASRTGFEFPGMITAIVGPNGSGKSNVTDGLRWVLGEQSYSLLRGKKTEDMIFTGSDQRPRAGMAACTIIFDNSDGWLPIDYSEVAITRRAYRDGQNEYLLNGQRVRLKDISELLAQSGLSERTYSIIGQGLIDNSLALRPEERRKLFEEAAGIGLYRGRRNESLNRLEVTRRNMERVNDILVELAPRITILEKQARKAEDFERIKADLRMVLREWYGYHWYKGQEDIADSREHQNAQEKHLEQVKNKHEGINKQITELRKEIQNLRDEINTWHTQASDLHIEKEIILKELAVRDERVRSLTDQINAYELDITRLEEEIRSSQLSLDEISNESQDIKTDLNSLLEKEILLNKQISGIQNQRDQIDKVIKELRKSISNLETGSIKNRIQLDEKSNRQKTLEKSFVDIASSIVELKNNAQLSNEKLQQAQKTNNDLCGQVKTIEDQLSFKIEESSLAKTEIELLLKEKTVLEQSISKLKIEIEMLEQAEKNLIGYPSGTKSLLHAIRNGDLSGFANALSSQMIVDEKYEHAISVALGEYTDAILLKKNSDPNIALSMLQMEQNGRTAIIPEGWIKSTPKVEKPDHKACIGNALDFIQFPGELHPFYELLLSRVLVITDRQYAREILALVPPDVMLVTLLGEVFFHNGKIIGGKNNTNTHISRPRQLQDLQTKLGKITPQLEKISKEITTKQTRFDNIVLEIKQKTDQKRALEIEQNKASGEYQSILMQLEKTNRQLDWNISQQEGIRREKTNLENDISALSGYYSENQKEIEAFNEQLKSSYTKLNLIIVDDLKRELSYTQTNIAVNQRAINELNKRITEKSTQIRNNSIILENLNEKLSVNKNAIQEIETGKNGRKMDEDQKNIILTELQEKILPAETRLKVLDDKYNELLITEENSQQMVNNAEKYFTQAQMDYFRKKEAIDQLQHRIEEDFGLVAFDYGKDITGPTPLPIEGMVEQLPVIKELTPELEESISRQKSLFRRIGSVNPEAKEEYESTKVRFDFLSQQINDLTQAEENLKHILIDLDILMKSEFQKTFNAVSEEFPQMFNKLLGGGSARLILSDPDDLNESGIEIHARLPGKREQELTLLSGGERSLTAVALIFALLKISPTPFCVLDEVDAMLDESNVGRFRELLLELSKEIQFILVTHNRNTVQAANVIYGITMGRDSTSQMVSLRLDEVPEELLARKR
jgi:chromosome segregation protein